MVPYVHQPRDESKEAEAHDQPAPPKGLSKTGWVLLIIFLWVFVNVTIFFGPQDEYANAWRDYKSEWIFAWCKVTGQEDPRSNFKLGPDIGGFILIDGANVRCMKVIEE